MEESRKSLRFKILMKNTEKHYKIQDSRRQMRLQTFQRYQIKEKEQTIRGLEK